jgi:hypothetical protein
MTIINNIEIDNIKYIHNDIKQTILLNKPLDNVLHVIAVISNPCLFAKRYILMKEFIYRMQQEENVHLYIVELLYPGQKYIITERSNKNHLQLKTDVPLWHKENMINLAVKKLLPKNYQAFAWIDADIEFENPNWAHDCLKILNGKCDIVQLFSHCIDLDNNDNAMNTFNSAGFQYSKGKKYVNKGSNYWHPGFAWAMTRTAYEKINGLYDKGILGSGDNIMLFCLMGMGLKALNSDSSEGYKQSILDYQSKINNLRFGYVPGVIRHYFHGSKKNRKYSERWQILVAHGYTPSMISYDSDGVIVPNDTFPEQLKVDILNYFKERNEDE